MRRYLDSASRRYMPQAWTCKWHVREVDDCRYRRRTLHYRRESRHQRYPCLIFPAIDAVAVFVKKIGMHSEWRTFRAFSAK